MDFDGEWGGGMEWGGFFGRERRLPGTPFYCAKTFAIDTTQGLGAG